MGTGINLSCLNCSYRKTLLTGIGMIYIPGIIQDIGTEEEYVAELIQSKSKVNKIRKLIVEKKAEVADEFGFEIYRCNTCSDFFDRFYFKLITDEISYEITYDCPRCKVEINPITHCSKKINSNCAEMIDFNQFPCPNCKEHNTFLISYLLYD